VHAEQLCVCRSENEGIQSLIKLYVSLKVLWREINPQGSTIWVYDSWKLIGFDLVEPHSEILKILLEKRLPIQNDYFDLIDGDIGVI
jgi:hypothetical protein